MTALAHHFKLSKCTARPSDRLGTPWKYCLEAGKIVPFKCPKCGEEIVHLKDYNDNAITCWVCGWTPAELTSKQRATLRTDPEKIPAKRYMERLEFNDNKNKIYGKSKRLKKAISRAC
jgi:predicted RNA-binding Zn-ribbon protein involved in translation (DUF1610 family)